MHIFTFLPTERKPNPRKKAPTLASLDTYNTSVALVNMEKDNAPSAMKVIIPKRNRDNSSSLHSSF